MKTFQFKDEQRDYCPQFEDYIDFETAIGVSKNFKNKIHRSLDYHDISGAPLPDEVIKHFKNADDLYFSDEVTKLSDYKKSFPDNNFTEEDLAYCIKEGYAVEVKDFFGNKETFILTSSLEEYDKPAESKCLQTFNEFAKPFITNDPSIDDEVTINAACSKIMSNYIDNQPDFFKSDNLKTARLYLNDSEISKIVSTVSGNHITYDLGMNAYDLGLNKAGKAAEKTSNYVDRNQLYMNRHSELWTYASILEQCSERGATKATSLKILNQLIKEANEQRKNFELQYNEKRREFDKNQPFKNQAFNIVDKLSDKFNQAVQGLKKVWQVVTTKNLAIEQSKDKQQTVQPQKNTPEVKQQSKAKDMER